MDFDLIVIGAGSGGVRAARMAAQAGKKVAVIEYQALGGTCVNVGCVPKKLFVYASQYAHHFSDAEGFGWASTVEQFDWAQLIQNKNAEIQRLNSIYGSLLEAAGVELIEGKASFLNASTVVVSEKHYTAEKFLVACGSKAYVPDFPGNDLVMTSDGMFFLDKLPNNILIVGGGFIAVEFAGILNSLGVETHLIYRRELFLRGFDQSTRQHLYQEMQKKGIKIQFNENITSIKKQAHGELECHLESGSIETYEMVLYATGRMPNTESLGLENAGVALDASKAIVVNDQFQTSAENIYAIGDVINRVQLTPVAIEEAMVLVDQLYGTRNKKMEYANIPCAVFSQPPLACVGLTEEEAAEQASLENFELEIFESDFRPMKYSLTNNFERTYMKIIVNKASQKVLGIHMLGDEAAEIIQGFAVAIKAGATKQDFDNTIGIHPSSAEEFVTMRSPSR